MAVKLRLRRMGKKKQPIYKVVAADARSPRDGRFIEALGLYNPKTDPATVEINEERALYWLSVGAQPTDTVKNLLSREGVILRLDLMKRGLSEEQISTEMDKWYALRAEKVTKAALKNETEKKQVEKKVEKVEKPVEEEKVAEVNDAASDVSEEQVVSSSDDE